MISRAKKLEALQNFTMMVGGDPAFAYLMGFLTGQVDRVHFVQDPAGADIAVRLSQGRLTVWPAEPFRATVGGVIIPNPMAFVAAASRSDRQICVSLNFERQDEALWYREVLVPDVSHVKGPSEAAEEEAKALRAEMDRALDIYSECKRMLEKDEEGRKKELDYYMKVAQEQMRQLSSKLEEVNAELRRLAAK
ncbi:MAG: hypothetical protein ACM3X3_06995 [Betaproteobacteria bacterium]